MVVCTFLSMNCYDTEYDVLRPRMFPPFWFGGVTDIFFVLITSNHVNVSNPFVEIRSIKRHFLT